MEHRLLFLQVLCLLVLYELADGINFPLTVRLLENAVCQQYFSSRHGIIHESECKNVNVQSRLALVRGIHSLCQTLLAIPFAPLFAELANYWKHRTVYSIALLGILLQLSSLYAVCIFWDFFPIEFVWLTAIFTVCGGGPHVIGGISLSIVSRAGSPEERGQYLFTTFAIHCFAGLIAPFIAAQLLDESLGLSILISVSCLLLSYPILLVMREPIDLVSTNRKNSERNFFRVNWEAYKNLLKDWRVKLCLTITFLSEIRFSNFSILISYVSTRFGWSIASVTRLLTIIPGVNFIVFLALPSVHKLLSKRLHRTQRSYTITIIMLGLLAVGDGLIIVASSIPSLIPALIIHALGYGVVAPFMPLASSYVDTTQLTRFYASFAMTDSFAHLLGDPLLQLSWKHGLHIGGQWLVLPFIFTFGCFVLAFFLCTTLPVVEAESNSYTEIEDESRPLMIS